MEKSTRIQPALIANDDIICTAVLPTPPRLTPTGKISHAKTRVYTQRYRKEWEQMDDFKGWLTSVPLQPTRSYCLYCKKNLHAHRLSLLKHTCTMKHQRAALAHEADEKKKVEIMGVMEVDNSREEGEENEEEYIIERLESEYDEQLGVKEEISMGINTKEEEETKEGGANEGLRLPLDLCYDDSKPVIKKVKLPEEKHRDTLAEAMAHVHNEYLEVESEDQENVQMVVVEPANNDMEVILPDSVDDQTKEMSKELRETSKSSRHSESKVDAKKSTGKILDDAKNDLVVTSLPILGTTYQIGTSTLTQNINVTPITTSQNRTITLTSGGKTLTLTGGTFQPGTQYVLNKIKGSKIPISMIADKKPIIAINQGDSEKTVQLTTMPSQNSPSPSTSQQSLKKPAYLKPKSNMRKLRISTHVVDTTKGVPVSGLQVSLYKLMDGRWTFMNESNTNPDGRCTDLLDSAKLSGMGGRYKIHFDVDKYFTLRMIETMYPFIEVVFDVKNPLGHYHIPVLLSPFGYSTYRGS